MTEQTPEPELQPAEPELSRMELVAQKAAEAAARARPDLGPRLAAVEESLQQILAALQAAAGPGGNAARLAARLDAAEATIAQLLAAEPAPHPEQQKLIDDLRLKVATLERNTPHAAR